MMSPRDQRALRMGIAAVALALLSLRVVPWAVRSASAERDRLHAGRALLLQARGELRAAARFQDSAAAIRQALDSIAAQVLSGGNEAEAWSDFENRVSLAATRNGAALKRSTRLPDSARSGLLKRITGRAELESDLPGILAALKAIERDPVVLRVGELRVEAVNPASQRGPEVLRAALVVEGWFLLEPKGGKEQ